MTSTALSVAERNASAPREGGCRACGRTGLPILPLRRAIVGTGSRAVSQNGALPQVPTAEGLRTLRTGYLYVLLDKKQWHAYAVTPEGCLRQFNPDEPPRAEPEPLSKACVTEGHDIASSFFNVDTGKHQTAWVAFASDPWPRSVLEAYRTGRAPLERFTQLDLSAARDNPQSAGLVLTPDALHVDTQVFEYAQASEGDFCSVHGFHSRHGKHEGLRGFVRTAMQRHHLQQGVLALVLDDPVGRVQEIDATRIKWVEARAKWEAQPDRAYRKLTSDCLVQLKEALQKQAQQEADAIVQAQKEQTRDWNENPFLLSKVPLPTIDEDSELRRIGEERTNDAHKDLEERYDEPSRAAFVAEYERQWKQFQEQIDSAGTSWAAAIEADTFKRIDKHDYDGEEANSALCYARTLCKCVRGGMTDAPDAMGTPKGPTVKLWKGWLDDPNSPPYQALALRNKSLLENLRPTRNADGTTALNDTQKLYDVASKLITSEDFGEKLLYAGVKDAAAQTLGALHSAAALLKPLLKAGVEDAVMRLTCTVLLLHERVHATQVKVTMTVAQYYVLQCRTLREQQARLTRQAGRKTGQQVASLLTTGVLSTQLNDAALAARTLEVTLWVEGKAQDVRKHLINETELLTSSVVVGVGTLEPAARQVLEDVKLGARGVADLTRRGFSGLRGASGSGVSLLLAVGALYLMQDSVQQNYKKVEDTVGVSHPEVLAAFAGSSMGVMGGGIEAVGLALQTGMEGARGAGVPVTEGALKAVRDIAKVGAVIGAAASAFDAMQAGMAADRAKRSGDRAASSAYKWSAGLYTLSGIFGVIAVESALILGPLGIAIALGLAAYAVSKWAEGEESAPIERWARRCYFGKHDETPSVWWNSPADGDIALAELNAITLGMNTGVQFDDAVVVTSTGTGLNPEEVAPATLRYRFILPGFNAEQSGYDWTLTAHRHSDFRKPAAGETVSRVGDYVSGEVLASGSYQTPAFDRPGIAIPTGKKPRWDDYERDSAHADVRALRTKGVIRGAITLIGNLKRMSIEAVTLRVTYWPDRNQPELCAEVTMHEVR